MSHVWATMPYVQYSHKMFVNCLDNRPNQLFSEMSLRDVMELPIYLTMLCVCMSGRCSQSIMFHLVGPYLFMDFSFSILLVILPCVNVIDHIFVIFFLGIEHLLCAYYIHQTTCIPLIYFSKCIRSPKMSCHSSNVHYIHVILYTTTRSFMHTCARSNVYGSRGR